MPFARVNAPLSRKTLASYPYLGYAHCNHKERDMDLNRRTLLQAVALTAAERVFNLAGGPGFVNGLANAIKGPVVAQTPSPWHPDRKYDDDADSAFLDSLFADGSKPLCREQVESLQSWINPRVSRYYGTDRTGEDYAKVIYCSTRSEFRLWLESSIAGILPPIRNINELTDEAITTHSRRRMNWWRWPFFVIFDPLTTPGCDAYPAHVLREFIATAVPFQYNEADFSS